MPTVLTVTTSEILKYSNIWAWNDGIKFILLIAGIILFLVGFINMDGIDDMVTAIIGLILIIYNVINVLTPWSANVNSASDFTKPYYYNRVVNKDRKAPKTIALRTRRDQFVWKQSKQLITQDKHMIKHNPSQKNYYQKQLNLTTQRANAIQGHLIKYNIYLYNVPKSDLKSPQLWTWL